MRPSFRSAGGVDARRRGSVVKLAGASYLATALAVITGPLVARGLGARGRGELAAASVYAAIITLVAGLGLPAAVSHAVATKAHPPGAVVGTIFRFVAWLGLVTVVLAVATVHGPLSSLSATGRLGAAVLIAIVPLGVLTNCLGSLLVAEGALGPITLLRVLPLLVTAVATFVLFVLGGLGVGVLLLVTIAATVATAVVSVVTARVRPAGRAPFGELLRFGLRGYGANLAVFATHLLDQAFILPTLGPRPLGYYALAVSISSVPNSVSLAIYSRYFTLVADAEDEESRTELISKGLRLTLLASLGPSLAIGVLCPFVVPLLYGGDFRESVLPLLILLPGSVIFCVSLVGESFLTAVGRPGRVTFAELGGLAVTLIGLPLVVPPFGIVGAAVLSSVSYAVVLTACIAFLRQVGPVSLRIRRDDIGELWLIARRPARRAWAAVRRSRHADSFRP